MNKIDIGVLKKCSTAVYLACEEPVAKDISLNIKWAINTIESQNELIDLLVEALEVCSDWSESAHSMHEAAVTALSLVKKGK